MTTLKSLHRICQSLKPLGGRGLAMSWKAASSSAGDALDTTPRSIYDTGGTAVTFCESAKEYTLTKELPPGVSRSDIRVQLGKGNLMIKVKHHSKFDTTVPGHEHVHAVGSCASAVITSLHMPPHVDKDFITASYSNGLLVVSMPKSEDHDDEVVNVEVEDVDVE